MNEPNTAHVAVLLYTKRLREHLRFTCKGNHDLIDEIAQTVYLNIISIPPKRFSTIRDVWGYIRRTAENARKDHHRSCTGHVPLSDDLALSVIADEPKAPSSALSDPVLARSVSECLPKCLKPADALIVRLHLIEGHSLATIADLTGRSLATTERYFRRSFQALIEYLTSLHSGDAS
jgi:DNA-directed RNA polymerase specialized sigma24 family protein